MSKSAVINFQILGDSKSGEQALQRTTAAADKVEPSAKIAGDALGSVKDKLLGMVPGGQAAEGALKQMSTAGGEVGSVFKGAVVGGAAAAGVAIADLAVQGVSKFSSLTGEVTKFKNVSGASAEEASKFIAVAKGYGTDVDVLSGAVFKMGANVEAQPQKFKDLGIEIAHNKDGTVDLVGTLENASKAYMATTDATQKDAIAKQIGGKAGQQLIPILKGGSAAIKEFGDAAAHRGLIFTDSDLKQGAEFRKSMRDLTQAATGLEIKLGKGLVPTITDTTKSVTGLIDGANSLSSGPLGKLKGLFTEVVRAVNPLAGGMELLRGHFRSAVDDTIPFGHSLDNLVFGHKKAKAATEDHAASLDQLNAATSAGVDVTDNMSGKDVDLAVEEKKVADARGGRRPGEAVGGDQQAAGRPSRGDRLRPRVQAGRAESGRRQPDRPREADRAERRHQAARRQQRRGEDGHHGSGQGAAGRHRGGGVGR
jgi:hypothetical protein